MHEYDPSGIGRRTSASNHTLATAPYFKSSATLRLAPSAPSPVLRTLGRLLRRLTSTFSRFGAFNGCLYLFARLAKGTTGGHISLRRYLFFAQAVPPQDPKAQKRRARFAPIRSALPDDPLVEQFPRCATVLETRWREGSHCLAADHEGQFLGYIWLHFGAYVEDEVRCRFVPTPGDKAAWDYDVYVIPERRLGLGFVCLWDAANEYLRERGYEWSVSRVSAFNTPSIRSHERMGAKALGSAIFLTVFGMQMMFSSKAPYLHVSFSSANMPSMNLPT
ncbi:MAG: GNAT family N-acetyltransferase [Pseudomonadota bacterium]